MAESPFIRVNPNKYFTPGSFGYLFYKKILTKVKKWGKARQFHAGLSLKYLQEGFGSIKDIKILQRSNELVKGCLL